MAADGSEFTLVRPSIRSSLGPFVRRPLGVVYTVINSGVFKSVHTMRKRS